MTDIKEDGPRMLFFQERIGTALGAKGSKLAAAFGKLVSSEDTNRHMADFINVPGVARVFVAEGTKDLVCFDTPPANQKKKMVYFLKLQQVALTAENINEVRGCDDCILRQRVPLQRFRGRGPKRRSPSSHACRW